MIEFIYLPWTVGIAFFLAQGLIVVAQPRLCDMKDYEIVAVAPLGTSINLSVCLIAEAFDLQFPVVKVDNQWIAKHQQTLNASFSWQKNNGSIPDVYFLTLYIQNITVFDYGEWTVRLNTASDLGLNFNFTVNPSDNKMFKFYLGESQEVICEVNWFPKKIEIKNKLTGHVLRIFSNDNQIEETKTVYDLSPSFGRECLKSGVYSCAVTDFKNRMYEKDLVIRTPGCPVMFCCENKTSELIATINETVNLTLCLFYNDNIDIVGVFIQSIRFTWKEDFKSDSYLLLHLFIHNVDASFAGYHTIEIITVNSRTNKRENLNKILFLWTLKDLIFCDKTSNYSEFFMVEKGNFKTGICFIGFYGDIKSARIKRRHEQVRTLNEKEEIQTVLKPYTSDHYLLQIDILNILVFPQEYEVELKTFSFSVYIYKFKVILKGRLERCENEQHYSFFSANQFGNLVMHFCFLTDYETDDMDYCFINNKRYPINEFEYDRDISVCVDQAKRNQQYYMQIYLHNISFSSLGENWYSLKITPVHYHSLLYNFYVKMNQEKDFEAINCDGGLLKMFYYTNLKDNLTVCVKFVSSGQKYSCFDRIYYKLIGEKGFNDSQLNNIFIRFSSSEITVDIINIADYNFGRYDVRLHTCGFSSSIFEYTFYLKYNQDLDLPSSVCKNGTVNFTLETHEGEASLCFRSFGDVDRSIIINNKSVPITRTISKQNHNVDNWRDVQGNGFLVFSRWSKEWRIRYIQIYMSTSNISHIYIKQTSSNRVLVYNLQIPVINKYIEYNTTCEGDGICIIQ
ncbi:hypothetical protein Bpfe_001230 [Biomphalaria pfeifferi]|uniref:Uncharacterized protein n=1 Tax=Biomphalaria pfeifferi TaxID=112525 RepID=A0AAD8FM64_BIOPF|nr:hypothetical protein Bpfe_001230 [Biomphalaria pfeifferi]